MHDEIHHNFNTKGLKPSKYVVPCSFSHNHTTTTQNVFYKFPHSSNQQWKQTLTCLFCLSPYKTVLNSLNMYNNWRWQNSGSFFINDKNGARFVSLQQILKHLIVHNKIQCNHTCTFSNSFKNLSIVLAWVKAFDAEI